MKKIKILFCLSIVSVMLFACSDDKEIENFKTNLKAQSDSQNMILEELTEFEWDKVYFIAPYMSKEKIEEIVGCESDNINDNMSDESILYIIFTNKNQFVNQIYGRPDTLGFDFKLGEYSEFFELDKADSIFSVSTINGVKVYSLVD